METKPKNNKFKNSVSFKLIVIAMLTLLLLIPTVFVQKLINERQSRRNSTISEVTSKWGEEQILFGPVLLIPYEIREQASKNYFVTRTYYFHVLPDDLQIQGTMFPEVRYRGIYKVITYGSELSLKGKFSAASFTNWPDNTDNILWSQARLVIGISDLTGLDQIKQLRWNDTTLNMEGGIPYTSSIEKGISAPLTIHPETDQEFNIDISLNGSESLFFVPAGKSTHITLESEWITPSFDGAQLPDERKVNESGFTAEWNALHLTRPFPQKWTGDEFKYEIPESSFGVNLLIPVDNYQKTTRSVKYALLFIGLTFLVIFFIEVMSKKRVHPVQYLLTGIALIIFYSLLLALSEHLPFAIAYLIASVSIIGLIVNYSRSIFKNRNYTLVSLAVLVALYGFLYAILNMSDMALLLGNVGLFVILAIIMFFSKKIDWYNGKVDSDLK